MVAMSLIREMAERIARTYDPDKIILFGSHARGAAAKRSDVDFLVIKETRESRTKRSVPLYALLEDIPVSKDILVYTSREIEDYKEWPFSLIHHALREGVVLYEKQARNPT